METEFNYAVPEVDDLRAYLAHPSAYEVRDLTCPYPTRQTQILKRKEEKKPNPIYPSVYTVSAAVLERHLGARLR